MSVSPAQNFLKPPPVPDSAVGTWTPRVRELEVLGDGLGDRIDGARAVDGHGAGQVGRGRARRPTLAGAVARRAADGAMVAPPPLHRRRGQRRHQGECADALGLVIVTRWFLLKRPVHLARPCLGQVLPV